jgi:2-methylcitrate dehydratase PrpD
MKDGRTLSIYVKEATGEIPHPLSWDALVAKFMVQVDFSQTVSRNDAEKLVEIIDKLEDVANVKSVIKLAIKREKK